MDMECDEVKPTVVEAAAEEKRTAVEDGVAAAEEERSSDSPAEVEGGSRPTTTPEVNMLIHATGQLTIFCAGSVHVFYGISPEKGMALPVNEIRLIAAAAANSGEKKKMGTACPVAVPSSPVLTRCPSLLSTAAAVASPQLQAGLGSELPIARRRSLQKFSEKRRDRLVSKSPYSTTKPANNTKTRMGNEPSPGAGCFGKSSILTGEFQTGGCFGKSSILAGEFQTGPAARLA